MPIPPAPGILGRIDHEYRRNGTANLFVFVDAHHCWRHVKVTQHRTNEDFARSSRTGHRPGCCMTSAFSTHQNQWGKVLVEIERLHAEAVVDKQRLMHAVLGAGTVSIVSGGLMMITDANDQAYRVAGGCALVFGVIDAAIALTSLRGIGRDARVWERDRAGRVTAADLQRARARWLSSERGEGVAYAVNLGLDIAYLSSGLTAVLASQLGAEHPERWLAGGLSVSVQALFLVGIDLAGLGQAGRLQKRLLHDLVPGVSLVGAYSEPAVRLTVAGRM